MIEAPAAPSCAQVAPWQADRYQLWSLLDMLRFYGASFLTAFGKFARVTGSLMERAFKELGLEDDRTLLRDSVRELIAAMSEVPISQSLKGQAERLEADISEASPIQLTDRDIMLLSRELHNNLVTELASHLFLFVPEARKKLFLKPEAWFGDSVLTKFGDARVDMRDCARCIALAQWTASIFHAMRILEHGLRALADRLQVTFSSPIELENWKNIIDQLEKAIRAQEALPKSAAKSAELQFCAHAASHFWYFKEAWRNHVSHGRENYGEEEALKVVKNVREFMQDLAA